MSLVSTVHIEDIKEAICGVCGWSGNGRWCAEATEDNCGPALNDLLSILSVSYNDRVPLDFVCAICLEKVRLLCERLCQIRNEYAQVQNLLREYYEAYEDHRLRPSWDDFKSARGDDSNSKDTREYEESESDRSDNNAESTTRFADVQDSDTTTDSKTNELKTKVNRNGYTYATSAPNYVEQDPDGAFTCKLCDATFKWLHKAESHVRSQHTQERPFPCKICGKRFTVTSYLNRHMLSVHEDAKFFCQTCGLAFRRRYNLTAHEKIHETVPNLECPVEGCKKMFYTASALREHTAKTHSTKEFICDICGKIFKTSYHLSTHLKRHKDKL